MDTGSYPLLPSMPMVNTTRIYGQSYWKYHRNMIDDEIFIFKKKKFNSTSRKKRAGSVANDTILQYIPMIQCGTSVPLTAGVNGTQIMKQTPLQRLPFGTSAPSQSANDGFPACSIYSSQQRGATVAISLCHDVAAVSSYSMYISEISIVLKVGMNIVTGNTSSVCRGVVLRNKLQLSSRISPVTTGPCCNRVLHCYKRALLV